MVAKTGHAALLFAVAVLVTQPAAGLAQAKAGKPPATSVAPEFLRLRLKDTQKTIDAKLKVRAQCGGENEDDNRNLGERQCSYRNPDPLVESVQVHFWKGWGTGAAALDFRFANPKSSPPKDVSAMEVANKIVSKLGQPVSKQPGESKRFYDLQVWTWRSQDWEATYTYAVARGDKKEQWPESFLLRSLEAKRWDEADTVKRQQEAEQKRKGAAKSSKF
jgi:hypothetical protein